MTSSSKDKAPLLREYLRQYTAAYTPLSVDLPPTFEEYLLVANKTTRSEYRKALKAGLSVVRETVAPGKELVEVMKSHEEKQGRKINLEYNDLNFSRVALNETWPVENYNTEYLRLYTCRLKGKVIGYLELLIVGKIAVVHAFMVHRDCLETGASRVLFLEVTKEICGVVDQLLYGTTASLRDNRLMFQSALGITKPFTYSLPEPIPVVALDADDLEITKPGLEHFLNLKEHYPNLKVTFFMVPIPSSVLQKKVTMSQYKEWAKWLKENGEWIEICPHGMTHSGHEMKYYEEKGKARLVDYETANLYIDAVEKMFKELDLPYQKIWKSPHWETSPEAYKALWDRGYTVAIDPNQPLPAGGKVYVYNWSIDTPWPGHQITKAHGHMYPPSGNAINLSLQTVMSMPENAQFRFISETIL